MPPQIQGTQAPRIALNTDFGHAPLGKLGDRSVEIGETTAPRAKSFGEKAKDFFSRVANAMTTSSHRVDSKFRQDLGKFSGNLSNSLGQIATGQGKEKIMAGLQTLVESSVPLSKQGANFDSVAGAQLKAKIAQMTPDELTALHRGLADAKAMGIDPASHEGKALALMLKEVAVGQFARSEGINEQLRDPVEQELQPLVMNLISAAKDETGRAGSTPGAKYTKAYEALQSKALAMARTIEPSGSPEVLKMIQNSLVKEALLSGMGDNPVPLAKAMSFWPGSEIATVRDAAPLYSKEGETFPLTSICMGQIGLRAQDLDTDLHRSLDSLLSRTGDPSDRNSPMNDPVGFAKDVIALQKDLAAAKAHRDTHDLNWDSSIDVKYGQVLEHLESLVTGELNLGDLSTQTFGELRLALDKMELTGAETAFRKDGEARLEKAGENYLHTVMTLLNNLQTQDTTSQLRSLRELTQAANQVQNTMDATGLKFGRSENLQEFRDNILQAELLHLSPEQRESVYNLLTSPHTFLLEDQMGSMGKEILSSDRFPESMHARGGDMVSTSAELNLIRMAIGKGIQSQGGILPPSRGAGDLKLEDLTPSQKTALREQFNVEVDPDGDFTVWKTTDYVRPTSIEDLMARKDDQPLQDAFQDKCEKRFAMENLEFMRLVRDLGPQPSFQQFKDLCAEYIGPKAPKQINIDTFLEKEILQTMNGSTVETFDIDKMQGLLERASQVVQKMTSNGPFKEFMEENRI